MGALDKLLSQRSAGALVLSHDCNFNLRAALRRRCKRARARNGLEVPSARGKACRPVTEALYGADLLCDIAQIPVHMTEVGDECSTWQKGARRRKIRRIVDEAARRQQPRPTGVSVRKASCRWGLTDLDLTSCLASPWEQLHSHHDASTEAQIGSVSIEDFVYPRRDARGTESHNPASGKRWRRSCALPRSLPWRVCRKHGHRRPKRPVR